MSFRKGWEDGFSGPTHIVTLTFCRVWPRLSHFRIGPKRRVDGKLFTSGIFLAQHDTIHCLLSFLRVTNRRENNANEERKLGVFARVQGHSSAHESSNGGSLNLTRQRVGLVKQSLQWTTQLEQLTEGLALSVWTDHPCCLAKRTPHTNQQHQEDFRPRSESKL